MLGRICAIGALVAVLSLSLGHTEKASATVMVHGCTPATISKVRTLASARVSKVHRLCAKAHKSATVVRFYHHRGRWAVAPRYPKVKQVPGLKWRQVVLKNRAILHYHQRRLVRLEGQIKQLLPQPKVPHDWLYSNLLCIHHYEGAWNANTGNGYYGGMQMDLAFQHLYGAESVRRWGTANNWPPWAQLLAARRAYASGRGFGPWPNTALACGLSTSQVSPGSISL